MRSTFFVFLLTGTFFHCDAYSVLTHEAIVDSAWESEIKPLLRSRFPGTSADDLRKAHAYVYGGCLIQDLGYVPLVPRPYSDLTHYVRSGDFVAALLREAKSLDEFAFALGTLAHYASDRIGHQTINRITPMVYPKLRRKFGDVVTYEDSPTYHLRTEFAIDVLQTSRGLYAPDSYHDFIGFEVSQDLLERAFEDTYGFPLKEIINEDMAIGTYRFAVGSVIPELTKIAWSSKSDEIKKAKPGIQGSSFRYSLPRNQYQKEWGDKRNKPGLGSRFLAFIIRILPKVGPLSMFGFKPIPAQGEAMFLKSFADTSAEYVRLLGQVRSGSLSFTDINLDTGEATRPGDYQLADKIYVSLVDRLAEKHFDSTPPGLRTNILGYFEHRNGATITAKTQMQLSELRDVRAAAQQSPAEVPPGHSESQPASTRPTSR